MSTHEMRELQPSRQHCLHRDDKSVPTLLSNTLPRDPLAKRKHPMSTNTITPTQASHLEQLAHSIIESIKTEQALPREHGMPGYRGTCNIHLEYRPPIRATRNGAHEDALTHLHKAGSHITHVLTIPASTLDGPAWPGATLTRAEHEEQIELRRKHYAQALEDNDIDRAELILRDIAYALYQLNNSTERTHTDA